MEKLAIEGGKPVRTEPFPGRTPFGDEEVELVTQAIRSQNLFRYGGTMVSRLEEEFPKAYGVGYGVASTSGTSAIHVAVGAIDPNPGDEIITAPITDLGSVIPILCQNAIPVFADVDDTYNIDPEDVERRITPRTRAIVVVHLFGNPCDMDAILDISKRHGIPIIEDCSQAHMTRYKGRYVGTIGDIGAFSFQQSKHMTTGDGGMTVTDDETYWERMKLFADKGYSRGKHGPRAYVAHGMNYRMTELQGAVGLAQLKKVRSVVERRMKLGDLLSELISDVDGIKPAPKTPGAEHSYWSYPLRVERWSATDFARALSAEGVGAGAGYIGKPIFLCAESLYSKRVYGNSGCPFDCKYTTGTYRYDEDTCPHTVEVLNHMVNFTFNENYTEADIEDIARAIRKVACGLKT